jgi:hypothetical protein
MDYDLNALLKADKARSYYKDEIVGKKCNCEWPCQLPINMLYDWRSYARIAKALFRPDQAVQEILQQ